MRTERPCFCQTPKVIRAQSLNALRKFTEELKSDQFQGGDLYTPFQVRTCCVKWHQVGDEWDPNASVWPEEQVLSCHVCFDGIGCPPVPRGATAGLRVPSLVLTPFQ